MAGRTTSRSEMATRRTRTDDGAASDQGERPPRPAPDQRISLAFEIYALSARLGAYLDRALEGTGVRPSEYALYSLMLEAGPRTPSELAAMLGVPPTTLSTYLTAMQARGDVGRLPHPTDGRSSRIVLTDRGRGVIRRVNPAFTRAHLALETNLDRPSDEVRAVLAQVIEAIERADAELHGPGRHPPRTGDTTNS